MEDYQNSNADNLRRKYPKDKQGAKSEWLGMEQHMAEINDDLRRNEQEIISMRKKELLYDFSFTHPPTLDQNLTAKYSSSSRRSRKNSNSSSSKCRR